MKKTFIIALIMLFGLVIQVQAVSTNSNQSSKSNQSNSQSNQTGDAVQVQDKNKVQNKGEDTQIQTQEQNNFKTKEKKENKGQFNAQLHRSTIATFVQSLLAVADGESGIGQEVRVIANQQNDAKDRASDLISAVENRNKIKTFFIGTSYKNLGELRSQMVQSQNQIDQLRGLVDKAENEEDKTELQSQIQVLELEQTNINNFINQNESKFSLFGWAVKLFRK